MFVTKAFLVGLFVGWTAMTAGCGAHGVSGTTSHGISVASRDATSILGPWFMGGPYNVGMPCSIEASGSNLVVMNENGDRQFASFVSDQELAVPGWNNIRGRVVPDDLHQLRIEWSNGTWWVRYEATLPKPPGGKLCTPEDGDFFAYGPMRGTLCRPNVTPERVRDVLTRYRISNNEARYYQIVHYVPLEIGGSNQVDNLWPLPLELAKKWYLFTEGLIAAVNSGTISHMEAMSRIWHWSPNPGSSGPDLMGGMEG